MRPAYADERLTRLNKIYRVLLVSTVKYSVQHVYITSLASLCSRKCACSLQRYCSEDWNKDRPTGTHHPDARDPRASHSVAFIQVEILLNPIYTIIWYYCVSFESTRQINYSATCNCRHNMKEQQHRVGNHLTQSYNTRNNDRQGNESY
jgi:hypothetical protein